MNPKSKDDALQQTEKDLTDGIDAVHTPAQAGKVLDTLERAARDLREDEIPEVSIGLKTREKTAGYGFPVAIIVKVASQVASAAPEDKAALDEAVSHVTGGPDAVVAQPGTRNARRLLRHELFHRLQPLDALDAAVFVGINHLPHPPVSDLLFARLSWLMTGGTGWFILLAARLFSGRQAGWLTLLGVAPALWLATSTVEYPIKSFFRRRRPFLSLIQAIVVGRKPGSYSFPSGHSAAAFAGAVLLSRHLPAGRKVFYLVAGLVAFSRIYLGAHYPGDVISGSVLGSILARIYARLFSRLGLPALPSRK